MPTTYTFSNTQISGHYGDLSWAANYSPSGTPGVDDTVNITTTSSGYHPQAGTCNAEIVNLGPGGQASQIKGVALFTVPEGATAPLLTVGAAATITGGPTIHLPVVNNHTISCTSGYFYGTIVNNGTISGSSGGGCTYIGAITNNGTISSFTGMFQGAVFNGSADSTSATISDGIYTNPVVSAEANGAATITGGNFYGPATAGDATNEWAGKIEGGNFYGPLSAVPGFGIIQPGDSLLIYGRLTLDGTNWFAWQNPSSGTLIAYDRMLIDGDYIHVIAYSSLELDVSPYDQYLLKISLSSDRVVAVCHIGLSDRVSDLAILGNYIYVNPSQQNSHSILKIDKATYQIVEYFDLLVPGLALTSDTTYLYASAGQSPGLIYKIDTSSIPMVVAGTWNGDTSDSGKLEGNIRDMVVVGSYLYAAPYAGNNPDDTAHLMKITTSTMATDSYFSVTGRYAIFTICTDGTYIYGGFEDGVPSSLFKCRISDMSNQGLCDLGEGVTLDGLTYCNGYLYESSTSWEAVPGPVVTRYNTTTMTYESATARALSSTFASCRRLATDETVIYCALQAAAGVTLYPNSIGIQRISLTDLTNVGTPISQAADAVAVSAKTDWLTTTQSPTMSLGTSTVTLALATWENARNTDPGAENVASGTADYYIHGGTAKHPTYPTTVTTEDRFIRHDIKSNVTGVS